MNPRPVLSSLPSPGLHVASPRTLALPRVILPPRFATALRAATAAGFPPLLYLLDDGWLECGRIGVEQITEKTLPLPEDVPFVSQQITVLVVDGLLSLSFSPAQTHGTSLRCLYRPLMSPCRRSVSSPATCSSKWISIVLSIVSCTSLHAARSDFHVAVVCLALHCRRASRFLSSAAKRKLSLLTVRTIRACAE